MANMLEKKFTNEELGLELKSYIDKKQNVWFKGKEVAEILGYKNTVDAIRKHVSENHKRTFLLSQPVESTGQVIKDKKSYQRETRGQVQGRWIIFIDEAGFYELVFKSRLPSAKMFREWVFTKVLPSIRKYGYFKRFDSRIKQRVIIDGKKYYKHPVFSNYAASKNGDIISLKTKRIMSKIKQHSGYFSFNIYDIKLENPKTYYQHKFIYEVFRGPIPRFFQIDHINNCKKDNRLKNLQLLTPTQNKQNSNNKAVISINIKTCEEKQYVSIKKAAIELEICPSSIVKICRQIKHRKSATSKKDGKKYSFKYLNYN